MKTKKSKNKVNKEVKEVQKTQEQIEFEHILEMDKYTLGKIENMHPYVIEDVRKIYLEIFHALKGKVICRFVHTLVTFSQQDSLYQKGRTTGVKDKTVTNFKGGESYNNFGLAIDICLLKDINGKGTFDNHIWETNVDFTGEWKEYWMKIVEIFKKYDWEWGGDFESNKEIGHFQKTFGYSTQELLKKYNKKEFIPETFYLNL